MGRLDTEVGVRRLSVVAIGMFVLGVLALLACGGSSPADPHTASSSKVPGFDEARLTVQPGPGLAGGLDHACSLLASTPAQHEKGLMGRHDLAGYPAMVFTFEQDSTVSFYNRDVPIALTVAWFNAQGTFIDAKDLAPCPNVAGCPTIGSPAPFRYALEVRKGGLAGIGVGPGSTITVAPGCGG